MMFSNKNRHPYSSTAADPRLLESSLAAFVRSSVASTQWKTVRHLPLLASRILPPRFLHLTLHTRPSTTNLFISRLFLPRARVREAAPGGDEGEHSGDLRSLFQTLPGARQVRILLLPLIFPSHPPSIRFSSPSRPSAVSLATSVH